MLWLCPEKPVIIDNPEEGVEVDRIGNTVVGTVGDCTGGCLTKNAFSSVQFWKEIQKYSSRFHGNDLQRFIIICWVFSFAKSKY